jgi:hypothetical protein
VAPRSRSWKSLSPGRRRSWIASHGGEGDAARRENRARAAYEGGARQTPAQRGHEPSIVRAGRTISAYFGPTATYRDVRRPNRAEARRLGRYDALVGRLSRGEITGAEFRRRVRSWRPVAGEQLASDPDAVLAALEQRRAADLELFSYSSGRAA